jgi:hypothetical protein
MDRVIKTNVRDGFASRPFGSEISSKFFGMNNQTNGIPLHIKYTLEFLVVFLGVTISFWLSEWNEGRKTDEKHREDIISLLQDLERDEQRLARVDTSIMEGMSKTKRLIAATEDLRADRIGYSTFADSMIAIGAPYDYSTFFMNTATYKSLLSNGRIQEFPPEVNKRIRDYYEYVSKRVEDNNHIVDDVCLNYYNQHHLLVNFMQGEEPRKSSEEAKRFLMEPDIREHLEQMAFLTQTQAMKVRISIHQNQVEGYLQIRALVDSAVRAYAEGLGMELDMVS